MAKYPARTPWQRWVVVAAGLLLAACAVPEWQKIGTPAPELAQAMGEPQIKVDLADGSQRWVYSLQPAGQQVYHMVLDAQQRLSRVEQVLQASHFQQLQQGIDNRQTVFEYFGKPALVERVGNFNGDIWTYRIRENTFDRQAHVFIDPQGVVHHVMFTDEPRWDDDRR